VVLTNANSKTASARAYDSDGETPTMIATVASRNALTESVRVVVVESLFFSFRSNEKSNTESHVPMLEIDVHDAWRCREKIGDQAARLRNSEHHFIRSTTTHVRTDSSSATYDSDSRVIAADAAKPFNATNRCSSDSLSNDVWRKI
jgi:hypothetical protein